MKSASGSTTWRRATLLYEELVAHGQGTGDNLATRFRTTTDSHQTSLGLFVTDSTYVGKNGYSLRLDGLDEGINDRARERAIVMHGAPYVSDEFAKAQRPARPQLGMPGGEQRRGEAADRSRQGRRARVRLLSRRSVAQVVEVSPRLRSLEITLLSLLAR